MKNAGRSWQYQSYFISALKGKLGSGGPSLHSAIGACDPVTGLALPGPGPKTGSFHRLDHTICQPGPLGLLICSHNSAFPKPHPHVSHSPPGSPPPRVHIVHLSTHSQTITPYPCTYKIHDAQSPTLAHFFISKSPIYLTRISRRAQFPLQS